MKANTRAKLLGWIILLPAGIIALTLARPAGWLPWGDRAFGYHQGIVRGSISDSEKGFQAGFEGRTAPEWKWTAPSAYRYTDVVLEWSSRTSSGKGKLHLPDMTLDENGKQVKVDDIWFQRLLGNPSLAAECLAVLEEARDGNLPAVDQPKQSYNRPFTRRALEHVSEGFRVPYPALAWTALWGIASAVYLPRLKKQR